MSEDDSLFAEAFAHQGTWLGGQRAKVARDALKLITLGRAHPKARLILAFADPIAARTVGGKSWLSEALKTWKIEVVVVDIGEEMRSRLVERQNEQRMVNPAADDADLET